MNSELLLAEIASLLQAGKKIEAIKTYRQLTGSSLNEAKFALEQIELGIGLAGAMVIQPDVAALTGLGDEGAQSVLLADVAHLLTRGKKIEAMKIYRQYTGLGLADAKNAVDRIERLIHPQGF